MFERLPKMFGNLSKEREISEKIWKEFCSKQEKMYLMVLKLIYF